MILHIKAKPGSPRNEIQRLPDGTLQIRIKAPAQEGKANSELILFLSKVFKVPKSQISLEAGQTSQFKRLDIPLEDELVSSILADYFK